MTTHSQGAASSTQNEKSGAGRYLLWIVIGLVVFAATFVFSTYTAFQSIVTRIEEKENFFDRGNLAVVEIVGPIMGAELWIKQLEEIEDSDAIQAAVIRVDSPGGAVAPSQELYSTILRIRQKKPTYCSFGSVAASGGYYLASACEKIYSNPGSSTGSIGVIAQLVNMRGLYDWARLDPYIIKAGRYKDMGSPLRRLTSDEQDYLQSHMNEIHSQFKNHVAAARPSLDRAVLEEWGDGRVFSGQKAKELGFVDEIGSLKDTINAVAEAASITNIRLARPSLTSRFRRLLEEQRSPLGESFLERLSVVQSLQLQNGVPYLLPESYAGVSANESHRSSGGPRSR